MRQVPRSMNVLEFQRRKDAQSKITVVTCYDYPSALIVEESEIDVALVGDSVAMAVHGHDTTLTATIEMMALHTKAVAKGLDKTFLVSDLPFLCHKEGMSATVQYVRTLMQAGAKAIKIEGGDDETCQTIQHLVSAGVPIMGHIGLTPQSIHQLGGPVIQGKEVACQTRLISEALKLQAAGCFALVIECVPTTLAELITEKLDIPTIGIGAGPKTDGQVLVWHDLLGLQSDFKPKFLKQYAEGKMQFLRALNGYSQEVSAQQFPSLEHSF